MAQYFAHFQALLIVLLHLRPLSLQADHLFYLVLKSQQKQEVGHEYSARKSAVQCIARMSDQIMMLV